MIEVNKRTEGELTITVTEESKLKYIVTFSIKVDRWRKVWLLSPSLPNLGLRRASLYRGRQHLNWFAHGGQEGQAWSFILLHSRLISPLGNNT